MSLRGLDQLQTSPTPAYIESGWATRLVRSPTFGVVSFTVIAGNAIWLAVDTDMNKADLLVNADIQFQVMEHAFCTYFTAEWLIRCAAFRTWRLALRDTWFVFDTFLVLLMVVETWAMSLVVLATTDGSRSSIDLGSASILKILRLLRLTRVSRMVRLLRSLPELLFMLHGVAQAMRSVGCTLICLFGVVYVFGIAFAQLGEGYEFGAKYFRTVPSAMYTLILDGALLDGPKTVMDAILEENLFACLLFGLVILIAHLMITNMLIGVLCDVVTKVSAKEKEDMDYGLVKEKLSLLLLAGGMDPADTEQKISKETFAKLVHQEEALELLEKAGVDPVVLLDFADFFFQSDKFGRQFDRQISFEEFVRLIMKLRQGNAPAMRDITELRRHVRDECLALKVTLSSIKEGQQMLEAKLGQ